MILSTEKRLTRLESLYEAEQVNQRDALERDYAAAVERGDMGTAAELCRKIRNLMLASSDAYMTLDRFEIRLPENITTLNLLTCVKDFFDGIKNMISGDWAKYRQALRDIPLQPGFPLSVVWPEVPAEREHNG